MITIAHPEHSSGELKRKEKKDLYKKIIQKKQKNNNKQTTRPFARQDRSPDIAHFVSGKFCDLDFDMTWLGVCVCRAGGGGDGESSICLYTK